MPDPSQSDGLLTRRLDALRAEREELLVLTRAETSGDTADQATDVGASIRLQLLEEHIATVELELELARSRSRGHVEGIVSVGDVVTVDLGDGAETYLIGSVQTAVAGVDTITPASPLGQAIVGAGVGSTIAYEVRPGVTLQVVVLGSGQALPEVS